MKHDLSTADDLVRLEEALQMHDTTGAPEKAEKAETKTIKSLRIKSISELQSIRAFAGQNLEFVIEGLIAAGTITAITGDSGSGKSTLITAMAAAVSLGVPFAGRATQHRPVLILDRENPISVFIERLDRLGASDSHNFVIWGGWHPEEAPLPDDPIIIRWLQSCDPKPLIIIDSMKAFHEGDENDATEVRKFFGPLRRLADLGATIVFLHHCGRTEKDYRGSSDIKAAIDVGYKLTNSGDFSRLGQLTLRAWKARYRVSREMVFEYRDGCFNSDSQAARTDEEIIQQLVIDNSKISTSQLERLATGKGVRRARVRSLVSRWTAIGKLHLETGNRGTKLHTWVGGKPSS